MSELEQNVNEAPEEEVVVEADDEVIVDDGPSPFVDDEPDSSLPPSDPEAARLAKALGWKEPTEWKGDTTNYMSAEKYLEIHSKRLERLPELQTQNDELRRELVRLQNEVESRFTQQDQQSRQALEAEMDRAAEIGDMRRYRELKEKLVKQPEHPRVEADPNQEAIEYQRQASQDPVFQTWAMENSWYIDGANRADPEAFAKFNYANELARQEYERIGVRGPLDLDPQARTAFYRNIAEKVNSSAMFGGKSGSKVPPYQPGASSRSTARPIKRARSFDSLSGEAKQAFQKLVRMKAFSDDDKGRSEYVKMLEEQ